MSPVKMMLVIGSLVRLILAIGLCSLQAGKALGDEQREDSSELENYKLRLRANDYTIQELGQQLKRIKQKLRSVNFKARHEYEIIESAASNLEGNACEDNEFQCDTRGQFERQCVSELLLCDGIKDCLNGQDEDHALCRVSELHTGISFTGFFAKMVGCMINTRHAYFCQIKVVSVTRSKVYPALLSLGMQSECKVYLGGVIGGNNTQEVKSTVVGPYSIANRRWLAAEGDFSSECFFTDTFRAMWCNSRQGVTSCANRLFYYRDD